MENELRSQGFVDGDGKNKDNDGNGRKVYEEHKDEKNDYHS